MFRQLRLHQTSVGSRHQLSRLQKTRMIRRKVLRQFVLAVVRWNPPRRSVPTMKPVVTHATEIGAGRVLWDVVERMRIMHRHRTLRQYL